MAVPAEIREVAAEVTISLISIAPGLNVVGQLLPETTKTAVRAAYGIEKADTLEKAVRQALKVESDEILGSVRSKPGTHEYGAPYSAVTDFRDALRATPLNARLIAAALVDPLVLENAIRANCPEEHLKWASKLRRETFEKVLKRFTAAILALAPQVPAVVFAITLETYRQVSELRAIVEADSKPA